MSSQYYAIKRKNGSIVKHIVLTRQSNKLFSNASIETLFFNEESKAQQVANALKGECKVVVYDENMKIAA